MFDVDKDAIDVDKLPVPDHILNPPTISRVADEDITHNLSLEDLQDRLNEFVSESKAKDFLKDVSKMLERDTPLTNEELSSLDSRHFEYATPKERGEIAAKVLNQGTTAEHADAAKAIMRTDWFGATSSLESTLETQEAFRTELQAAVGVEEGYARLNLNEPEAALMASTSVRSLLNGLANGLSDEDLREQFTQPGLSTKDLLGVLRYVTPEKRVEFLEKLFELDSLGSSAQEFVEGKLDNALHFTSQSERELLIKRLLSSENPASKADYIEALLEGSKNLTELKETIDSVGADRLLALGDSGVKEAVATGVLLSELSSMELPELPVANASQAELSEFLDAMGQALSDRIEAVEAHDELRGSRAYNEAKSALEFDLRYLNQDRATATSVEQLRELGDTLRTMVEVESRFGVSLTHTESGPDARRWTSKDVKEIKQLLEHFPEDTLLFTPILHDIKRVDEIQGAYAARYWDGVIRVADICIDDQFIQRAYGVGSSLQLVLAHEIGHGIQLGLHPSSLEQTPDGGVEFSKGDPIYDFAEWMEISGWTVYSPDDVEILNGGQSAQIGDQEYPIGVPVDIDGTSVILQYQRGLLYSFDTDAPFSLDPYSRTNPWEDFAEAFCEYIMIPERLIEFAPEKFIFLEKEFRLYDDQLELMRNAEQRIAGEGDPFTGSAMLRAASQGNPDGERPTNHPNFIERKGNHDAREED